MHGKPTAALRPARFRPPRPLPSTAGAGRPGEGRGIPLHRLPAHQVSCAFGLPFCSLSFGSLLPACGSQPSAPEPLPVLHVCPLHDSRACRRAASPQGRPVRAGRPQAGAHPAGRLHRGGAGLHPRCRPRCTAGPPAGQQAPDTWRSRRPLVHCLPLRQASLDATTNPAGGLAAQGRRRDHRAHGALRRQRGQGSLGRQLTAGAPLRVWHPGGRGRSLRPCTECIHHLSPCLLSPLQFNLMALIEDRRQKCRREIAAQQHLQARGWPLPFAAGGAVPQPFTRPCSS